MTKLYKWITGIVIGVLLPTILVQSCNNKSLRKDNQIQSVQLIVANDSAKIYKNKAGEAYSTLNSVVIDRDVLKKSLDIAGFTIKDLKAKDIKYQNIIAVLNAKIKSIGSGSTAGRDTTIINITDTIIGRKYNNWSNGNLSLYDLYSDKDSLHHKYTYETGITLFPERQGNKTKVTATLTDTHATVTAGYSIIVDSKKPSTFWTWTWRVASFAGGYYLGRQ